MSILDKWLQKRGFKNADELSEERINGMSSEKDIYDRYRVILSGETITVEKLEEFCKAQINLIEEKFAGAETKDDKYLKACLHVYLNLLKAIHAPEAERASLEKYLTQIING